MGEAEKRDNVRWLRASDFKVHTGREPVESAVVIPFPAERRAREAMAKLPEYLAEDGWVRPW